MYNNIIYATESEARAYILPTSSQALFMDPSSPVFYVKSTDAFGQSSFEIGDFTLRKETPTTPQYVTAEDLTSFKEELMSLIASQAKEVSPNA